MRVYKVTAPGKVAWVGSQGDAGKARKQFNSEGAHRKHIETHEVDVPTKKEELLTWLNANVGFRGPETGNG